MIGEHLLDLQTQEKLLSLGIEQPELLPASVLFAIPLLWVAAGCLFHDRNEPRSLLAILLPLAWDIEYSWLNFKLLMFLLSGCSFVAVVYKLLRWLI